MPVFITFRVHGLLASLDRDKRSRESLECVKAIPRVYIYIYTRALAIYIESRTISAIVRRAQFSLRPIVVQVSTSRILSHPCLVTEAFHRRIRFLTAKCNDDDDDETRIRLVVVHEIAPIFPTRF